MPTLFTTADGVEQLESESVVQVRANGDSTIATHLLGPLSPKTRAPVKLDITVEVHAAEEKAAIHLPGRPNALEIEKGRWSDWLKVKSKLGLLQSTRGIVRFFLRRLEPQFELYASPINFDPEAPLFPISSPPEYASRLASQLGSFYTAGMVEEHTGLLNGRIDEEAFLVQCEGVWREREAMMLRELARQQDTQYQPHNPGHQTGPQQRAVHLAQKLGLL